MKIFTSILVLLFSCNLVFAGDCRATSCTSFRYLTSKEYREKLDKVNSIFYGEVISASDVIQPIGKLPHQNLKIKVSRIWKGIETNEIDVEYGLYDSDCSIKQGDKRIFYAFYSQDEQKFQTGQCANDNYFDERMKHELGEGKDLEKTTRQVDQLAQSNTVQESFWFSIWKKIVSLFS
jgi:hypothetical protein